MRPELHPFLIHCSQMAYSEKFMLSFVRANELFGDLPTVSLSGAPADGPAGSGSASTASGMVEELAGTERALFVGLEKVRAWREANTLAVGIRFSRPLTGRRFGPPQRHGSRPQPSPFVC